MSQYSMLAADLAAVLALVGLFLVRHGRREMVVAYLGVNIGVLAVTTALANSAVGAGLGLGLFGVLSIIRLRSEELAQHEVAYYFAALALGLLGGLTTSPNPLQLALMAAVVLAVYLGDHPRLAPPSTVQELVLDHAMTDLAALTTHLEELLGADVLAITVRRTDLVNDTTLVQVRYVPGRGDATTTPVATLADRNRDAA